MPPRTGDSSASSALPTTWLYHCEKLSSWSARSSTYFSLSVMLPPEYSLVTTQVPFLCRLRRQRGKSEGSEDTSRSGQGTASPGTPYCVVTNKHKKLVLLQGRVCY